MGFMNFKKYIGIVLVLAVGFSPVISAYAAGSDCGNMCSTDSMMRHIDFTTKANIVSSFQGCCSENSMMPCDPGSGQAADVFKYVPNIRADEQDISGFILAAIYDFIGNFKLKNFDPKSHARTLALFTPIYLETLSLRF